MERMLKRVFDYQRFSSSSCLDAMITEAQSRYQPLDDEDLFLVAAAGEADKMNDFPENKDAYTDRNL